MRGIRPRIAAPPPRRICALPTFFLQPHAFLCRATRYWVIADQERNKYLCVDRRQFEALGPWLHGWEENTAQSGWRASRPPDDAVALAKRLLDLKILSERAEHAKDARCTTYPSATDALDLDLPLRSRTSTYTHALRFFLSSASASRRLKNERFGSLITSVRARKSRNRDPASPFDIERAHSLTSIFDRLRLFYPRPYLCLFDSLALLNFLARFGLYPDWVFGVVADPFEAHCWVQAGSVVLNDTIERVSAFTPIMYV